MRIDDLLGMAIARDASNLHLKAGGFPVLSINGELIPQEHISVITAEDMKTIFTEVTTDGQRKAFAEELEADFAYQASGIGRFRINVYQQGDMISREEALARSTDPEELKEMLKGH